MTKKKKREPTILGFSDIEILGHPVRVIETDDVNELLNSGQVCYGVCRPKDNEIIIDKRQTKQAIKQTFYHELLHYIDYIMHNEEFKYEEEVVNVLATGLSTVKAKD